MKSTNDSLVKPFHTYVDKGCPKCGLLAGFWRTQYVKDPAGFLAHKEVLRVYCTCGHNWYTETKDKAVDVQAISNTSTS